MNQMRLQKNYDYELRITNYDLRRLQMSHSYGVFIVKFKQISNFFLLFSLLTLNKYLSAGKSLFFFFYQGFLSRALTTHRTAGEGKGPSFIPLYHSHPLTNIQTFICNFACEMTITYF